LANVQSNPERFSSVLGDVIISLRLDAAYFLRIAA
jgi:hypothetical protein